MPACAILFTDNVLLGAPLVAACESRWGLMAMPPPLLEPGENGLEENEEPCPVWSAQFLVSGGQGQM
jgi:hypothetical protein